MINLLPDETKSEIRAARANVVLLRYNFLTLATLAALGGLFALFWIILTTTQSNALTTNNDNIAKAASFSKVRSQADEYRSNLKIAGQIIDKDVNYTAAIFAITKLLPQGVVLDNIDLTAASFGQQATFSAHAKTYEQATILKSKFQESKAFTNVYFLSLKDEAAEGSGGTGTAYPIAISFSAKLNKVLE